MMAWADICCGSGAITLALLSRGRVAPPAGYMGGKRYYATDIIRLMGGWQSPGRVVLCDAGPWGAWWHLVLTEGHGDRVAAAVARLARHRLQGADLHRWLCEARPADAIEQAAAFIALQASAARGRPVVPLPDGRWRTEGYAHLSDSARAKGFTERLRPALLAQQVLDAVMLDWPPTTVVHGDAAAVEPAGGRVVIDPPYLDTTSYDDDLDRHQVCAIARRHADSGALVGVCEAEPLGLRPSPLVGWTSTRLRRAGRMPRAARVEEWLTTSAPPAPPQVELPWCRPRPSDTVLAYG